MVLLLPVSCQKEFSCFVFHGAVLIPYVQEAVLNLPHPYSKVHCTVHLDIGAVHVMLV